MCVLLFSSKCRLIQFSLAGSASSLSWVVLRGVCRRGRAAGQPVAKAQLVHGNTESFRTRSCLSALQTDSPYVAFPDEQTRGDSQGSGRNLSSQVPAGSNLHMPFFFLAA